MVSAGTPVIIAKAYTTNLVAVVQEASQKDLAPVILWPYTGPEAPFAPWLLRDLGDGSYEINPVTSTTRPQGCLDVAHGSTADGGQIIQHSWNNGPNQKWRLVPRADGFLAFVAGKSGKCLTAQGDPTALVGPAQGLQLTQYGRDDSNRDQAWALVL
jgi:hypothetical protein